MQKNELELIKSELLGAFLKIKVSDYNKDQTFELLEYNQKAKQTLHINAKSNFNVIRALKKHIASDVSWKNIIDKSNANNENTEFETHNSQTGKQYAIKIASAEQNVCLVNILHTGKNNNYHQTKETEGKTIKLSDYNQYLIDNSPTGVLLYETNGQCILCNTAAADIIGAKSKQEVLKQNIYHLESWKKYGLLELFNKCVETGEKQYDNIRIITSFNKEIWLDCNFISVVYNNIQRVMLILDDTTEKKQYEKSIKKNLQQQKLLSKVAFTLNAHENFETGIQNTLEFIGQHTKASRIYLFKESDDKRFVYKMYEWCNPEVPATKRKKQKFKNTALIKTWKKKLAGNGLISITDIENSNETLPEFVSGKSKSYLHIPICFFGNCEGFIGIEDHIHDKKLTEVESEAFKTISQMFSNAFKRKMIGDNLQESEERFKKISANAQDGIILIDHQGMVSYWNKAAEKIFGYTKDDILGKNLHKLITSESDYEKFRKGMVRFEKSGEGNAIGKVIEVQAYDKNRERIDVELSLSSIKINNQWHAAGIVRDITKRKQAETELRTLYKA
ncbi:MAG: PAS domain S-box protein, partial [Bacteroidota bacterium]